MCLCAAQAVYNSTWHPSVKTLFRRHMGITERMKLRDAPFRSTDTDATWEWHVLDSYWECYYKMGWHLVQYGDKRGAVHKLEMEEVQTADGQWKLEQRDVGEQAWKHAHHYALNTYKVR